MVLNQTSHTWLRRISHVLCCFWMGLCIASSHDPDMLEDFQERSSGRGGGWVWGRASTSGRHLGETRAECALTLSGWNMPSKIVTGSKICVVSWHVSNDSPAAKDYRNRLLSQHSTKQACHMAFSISAMIMPFTPSTSDVGDWAISRTKIHRRTLLDHVLRGPCWAAFLTQYPMVSGNRHNSQYARSLTSVSRCYVFLLRWGEWPAINVIIAWYLEWL